MKLYVYSSRQRKYGSTKRKNTLYQVEGEFGLSSKGSPLFGYKRNNTITIYKYYKYLE